MGNKKTYVEKQDEEAEKNDMCDVGGRRRNTVLDTVGYQKRCQQLARQVVPGHAETADGTLLDIGDAGTGEGEVHYWIIKIKEMLAREKVAIPASPPG